MPSSIARLPATLASLATLFIVTAMSGSVWGDDSRAVLITRADLLQWHSVLMVPRASCMKQDWNSTLSAIATQDAVRFHAATETAGFGDTVGSGCDPVPDSRDMPAAVRPPADDATGKPPRLNRFSR